MWRVQRQRLDGSVLNQVIFTILQHKPLEGPGSPEIWGGCTFIVDLGRNEGEQAIRYVIRKPLYYPNPKGSRIERAQRWAKDTAMVSLATLYGMDSADEPFAMLHAGH
jgi:hypothetical protein